MSSSSAHLPRRPCGGIVRRWLVSALLLAVCVAGGPAVAQDKIQTVPLDGRELRLPLPPDACDLDPSNRRDRLLIQAFETMEPGIDRPRRMLRRFAHCGELADWRESRRNAVPDMVEIAVLTMDRKPTDRAAWLSGLREKLTVERGERIAATWTSSPPDLSGPAGRNRYGPVVLLDPERDDRALYSALLMRVGVAGRPAALAAVGAWTIAADQPLVLISVGAWEGEGSLVGWLAEEQRDLVDRVLSVNGEDRRRFARADRAPAAERRDPEGRQYRDLLSRNASWIAAGMIGVGGILIATGMIGTRILRRRTT